MKTSSFEEIESLPRASGVYALFSGDTCLWVGISCNIKSRIRCHKCKLLFDRIEYLLAPETTLTPLEREWMARLGPSLNRRPAYPRSHPKRGRHGWYWSSRAQKWVQESFRIVRGHRQKGICTVREKYNPEIHLPSERPGYIKPWERAA